MCKFEYMNDNTSTPSCFQMKKRRFLSSDINISLKQHKDIYGFHKGDLVEQKPGQHRSTSIAYNFHLVSPQLSLKHSEETINSLEAIHFTPKCMSTFLIGSEVVR